MKLWKLGLLCLCVPAFGQGVRFDNNIFTSANNVPAGSQSTMFTVPFAKITVCAYPDDGGQPCTNTVSVYQNPGLSIVQSQPIQADVHGRFGFWKQAGTYTYSVMSPGGTFLGTYVISLGGSASGGCTLSGVPGHAVIFTPDGTTCSGNSRFTYNPDISSAGEVNINSGAFFQIDGVDDSNNTYMNGDQIVLTNHGESSLQTAVTVNLDETAYTGVGTGPLAYLAFLEVDKAGHSGTGFLTQPSVGNAAVGTITGYQSGAPNLGLGTANKYWGFVSSGAGATALTEEFSYFANSLQTSLIHANYCDFMAKTQGDFVTRAYIGCGPTATSLFSGPTTIGNTLTVADGTGHAGYAALNGNTTNATVVANSAGFMGPTSTSFTAYALQLPATGPTNSLPLLSCGTPSSGVSPCTFVAAAAGMVYPGAGIPNSTGSAWGTSYTTSGTGTVIALTNSPTFVTPALGTPASGVATNLTGLPLTTGVTGLLPIANGGTGTASPGIVAGTNVTVSGSWPNQTINSTATASTAFSALTGSTNTTAAMLVGTGASLAPTGSGTITPSVVNLAASGNGGVTGNLPNANLATQTANTVLGALTATTPSGLAMPSCSGGTNALIWTTGTGFGCNTITTGSATTIASSETVASSTTPTFSTSYNVSYNVLTANVTTFTLAAGSDGQAKTLTFCQNGTGGFTVAAPANVHGFFTVGLTASKCNSQHFNYSTAQTAWLADSAGVTNE